MRERVMLFFSSSWKPMAFAFGIILIGILVSIALQTQTFLILGPCIAVALLLVVFAALYQFINRRWLTGILSIVFLIVLIPIAGLASIICFLFIGSQRPWSWDNAQASLPDNLGTIILSNRSLNPPSLIPIPGHDEMWKVEIRTKKGITRTIRLPDSISGPPEFALSLVKTDKGSVVCLDSTGSESRYFDLLSTAVAKKPAGPKYKLGNFHENDEGMLQFFPYYDRPKAMGGLPGIISLAVAKDGTVYAADNSNDWLITYSRDGAFQRKWPLDGRHSLYDIALDTSGYIWVIQWGEQTLWKYNRYGKLTAKFEEHFDSPSGITVSPTGEIYVTDMVGLIYKIAPDGKLLASWGPARGNPPRSEYTPCGIDTLPTGRLVVASRNAGRIQIYSQDGKILDEWKVHSREFLSRGAPVSVATDATGNIYAAVWSKGEMYIEKYAHNGDFMSRWKAGIGKQEEMPVRIAVTDRYLYIADKSNRRILKYMLDGTRLADWGT